MGRVLLPGSCNGRVFEGVNVVRSGNETGVGVWALAIDTPSKVPASKRMIRCIRVILLERGAEHEPYRILILIGSECGKDYRKCRTIHRRKMGEIGGAGRAVTGFAGP
jgi:hypothetical protein